MSQQSEDDAVYNLMVDDATGDLQPKVDKILKEIFENFDKDKDGKWNLEEIQDFATATNGRPFEDSEIVESFEVDEEDSLLFAGFYQMYYMQTVSEPAETLKDFKKHGYDDNLELVSSRDQDKE
ncbi:hypothetical protein MFLAVUS_010173 [Mucor flavus]|uniref:EF-hand domain-containing protein n=1 Tax=Mucor flavus TaxID=439312 RepID=A0ABP9ZBZ4_9FUNG